MVVWQTTNFLATLFDNGTTPVGYYNGSQEIVNKEFSFGVKIYLLQIGKISIIFMM